MTEPKITVTEWVPFGHYGHTHYRIWTSATPFMCLQRHEWRQEDGSSIFDEWINVPARASAA